jgi:heme exporter protein CcmB
MSAWADATAIAVKDLRVELRARHAAIVIAPFVATFVVAFGLAIGPGVGLLRQTIPGLTWLAGLFAIVLAARRAYESEFADESITGLLLAPIEKSVVFIGKAAALGLQILVVQAFVLTLIALLYGLPGLGSASGLALTVPLGALGLGALGALLGAVASSPRTRESMLPLLLFPLAAPLLLATAGATERAIHGVVAVNWLSLLAVFDLMFWSLGTLLYGATMED